MSVSTAELRSAACPACGVSGRELSWLVIDAVVRPDLVAALRDGRLLHRRCPRCATEWVRSDPVLLVEHCGCAPLIVGAPDHTLLAGGDPLAEISTQAERARSALAALDRYPTGPALITPFLVLQLAVGRDVDADVENEQQSLAEVRARAGRDAADMYAIFLREIAEVAALHREALASQALAEATSLEDVQRLVEQRPEVLSQAVRDEQERVRDAAALAGDIPTVRAMEARMALLDALVAGVGPTAAWAAYEQAIGSLFRAHYEGELAAMWQALDAADGDNDAIIEAGEPLVTRLQELHMLPMLTAANLRLADAYFSAARGSSSEHVERACELYQNALSLLNGPVDAPELRLAALVNYGAALASRTEGDPGLNQERAAALQDEAISLTSLTTEPRLWAMAHANLALSLLNHEPPRRGSGARGEAARSAATEQAIGHLEQSLRWRTREREPLDWAFSSINLGVAYAGRLTGDRADNLRRAASLASDAEVGYRLAAQPLFRVQALLNLASASRLLASMDETSADDRAVQLAAAQSSVDEALEALGDHDHTPLLARVRREQILVLEARGAPAAETRQRLRELLDVLHVEAAAREVRDVGWQLGRLAAEDGDWPFAAAAFEKATQAAAVAVGRRATMDGRLDEIAQDSNLFRWAAYALLRDGRPQQAVETLEQGRARQLARWLDEDVVDLDALAEADPTLAGRYVDVRRRLDGPSPSTSLVDAGELADQFADIVGQIRELSGFERFLMLDQSWEALASMLTQHQAVAYPVTTPEGSAWLAMVRTDGVAAVSVIDMPALRSKGVYEALTDVDDSGVPQGGYLAARLDPNVGLGAEISRLSRTMGEQLMRPLAEFLVVQGIEEVCLIPIGLLGLVPLHALTWQDGAASVCLLDLMAVTHAPSAFVSGLCERRAASRSLFDNPLVVGSPLPSSQPLVAAGYEARMVDELLPGPATLLLEAQATRQEVARMLPSASLAHLACHAHAALDDEDVLSSAFVLAADEEMLASDVLTGGLSNARLVVASACQTGVLPGYEIADEALALSTVLLGAGSAGAVASLWSVDDYATTLLMVQFYEHLLGGDLKPAAALRVAQRWLRGLNGSEAEAFVASRPLLTELVALIGGHPPRDFADPSLWAAFTYNGR